MISSSIRVHNIYTITVIAFIFSLHVVIPMYSNSSFLNLFSSEDTIGLIYMTGAAVTILGFLIGPSFIRKIGNYTTIIILICIQIGLFYGLIISDTPWILASLFIIQSATSSLIGFCLDIFLEGYTTHSSVGKIRGLYTTSMNASWVIAPFIGSLLIGEGNYKNTYIASLAILFPLIYLVHRNFPKFHDPDYYHPSFWKTIKHISLDKDLTKLFYANIILQTFYSWMVVYSPIYLNKYIGFSWKEIGVIIVIMLLPFPLIQYPLGRLADKKYGEKEIMSIGFIIMGISTICLSFFTINNILVWSLLLFATRIGAASVEIMLETYFFKTVSSRDSGTLSFFRIGRPFSLFISSVLMIIGSMFVDFRYMFIVIGLVSLFALYPSMTIKDTA